MKIIIQNIWIRINQSNKQTKVQNIKRSLKKKRKKKIIKISYDQSI